MPGKPRRECLFLRSADRCWRAWLRAPFDCKARSPRRRSLSRPCRSGGSGRETRTQRPLPVRQRREVHALLPAKRRGRRIGRACLALCTTTRDRTVVARAVGRSGAARRRARKEPNDRVRSASMARPEQARSRRSGVERASATNSVASAEPSRQAIVRAPRRRSRPGAAAPSAAAQAACSCPPGSEPRLRTRSTASCSLGVALAGVRRGQARRRLTARSRDDVFAGLRPARVFGQTTLRLADRHVRRSRRGSQVRFVTATSDRSWPLAPAPATCIRACGGDACGPCAPVRLLPRRGVSRGEMPRPHGGLSPRTPIIPACPRSAHRTAPPPNWAARR